MAFEEQIKSFRNWAVSLGCPADVVPTEDALRSIFKSGHSQLFKSLQSRIHSRQHVEEVREKLLIAKMAKYEGKVVPISERSLLPEQMQNHLKMKDLNKEKEEAEQQLEEARKEFDERAAVIKAKNIQLIATKRKFELEKSQVAILKLKLESLEKALAEGLQTEAQILAATPVQLTSENSSEKLAMQAVKEALKELEKFYNICNAEDNNSYVLTEAKTHLWSQMRKIFANTPNVLIFNAIMKMKDEQLQEIIQLTKESANAEGTGGDPLSKPPLDNFTVKLLKTKADLMGVVAKYMNAKNEVAVLEERYVQKYSIFVEEFQKKVYGFNNITTVEEEENCEEVISDYILQYNMHNFYKARNDYLSEQIDKLRTELDAGAKKLENHEMMIASLKQMHSEMNTSVNRIQHDVVQLSQIKDKIIYSKNLLKNMLDDMNQKTKSNLVSTKLKGNISFMGVDSFCLANDSVFSSTKLDIDANATVMNSTLRRSFDNTTVMPGASNTTAVMPFNAGAAPTLPCHLLELNTFAEIPLEKLSCVPPACSFLLSANPFIVESQDLGSTIQLVPGHLLTPVGVEQEVGKRILWASTVAEHSTDIKLNLEPLIVDPHDLKMRARRQEDEITKYVDSIESISVKTGHRLEKAKRIFQFILDNPLAKYVPPNRTFNNANFAEYESEFNLYYRIATGGGGGGGSGGSGSSSKRS